MVTETTPKTDLVKDSGADAAVLAAAAAAISDLSEQEEPRVTDVEPTTETDETEPTLPRDYIADLEEEAFETHPRVKGYREKVEGRARQSENDRWQQALRMEVGEKAKIAQERDDARIELARFKAEDSMTEAIAEYVGSDEKDLRLYQRKAREALADFIPKAQYEHDLQARKDETASAREETRLSVLNGTLGILLMKLTPKQREQLQQRLPLPGEDRYEIHYLEQVRDFLMEPGSESRAGSVTARAQAVLEKAKGASSPVVAPASRKGLKPYKERTPEERRKMTPEEIDADVANWQKGGGERK